MKCQLELNSPSATVCRLRERICSPIRPYKITIITMGNAKKTHVDTSHKGNLSGYSSIAQNAESGISSFAVCNHRKMTTRKRKFFFRLIPMTQSQIFIFLLLGYLRKWTFVKTAKGTALKKLTTHSAPIILTARCKPDIV